MDTLSISYWLSQTPYPHPSAAAKLLTSLLPSCHTCNEPWLWLILWCLFTKPIAPVLPKPDPNSLLESLAIAPDEWQHLWCGSPWPAYESMDMSLQRLDLSEQMAFEIPTGESHQWVSPVWDPTVPSAWPDRGINQVHRSVSVKCILSFL